MSVPLTGIPIATIGTYLFGASCERAGHQPATTAHRGSPL